MLKQFILITIYLILLCVIEIYTQSKIQQNVLTINESGYYEIQGLNVMVFDDFYPDGHQGGLTIVQHGNRVAANGDIRLEPTPGQWSPVPKLIKKNVNKKNGIIEVTLSYPDEEKNGKGFNPITYPDLEFSYTIRTECAGNSIKLIVDLENPLPLHWVDKVGFNLELFPGNLFGEYYMMDEKSGAFPQQANGPTITDKDGGLQAAPLAVGNELVIAPGSSEKEIKILSH